MLKLTKEEGKFFNKNEIWHFLKYSRLSNNPSLCYFVEKNYRQKISWLLKLFQEPFYFFKLDFV